MKKIIFFIESLENSGGTERITTLIANSLTEKNFNISIITITGKHTPFFPVNKKISIYHLSRNIKKNPFYVFFAVKKLKNLLKELNAEYIITVGSINSIYTIPATLGTKVKNFCWEHFNYTIGRGVKLLRKISRIFCKKIIVLTHKDKILWEKHTYGKAKITVINNPSIFKKQSTKPINKNKIAISIGRLEPQKGFDKLIELWSKTGLKEYGWTLIIIGGGKEHNNLLTMINFYKLKDNIKIIPPTKNIDEIYKSANIYCMTSRFEGMPLVLLEALSFNIPLIAYDCNTGPSEIINNNENGLLIENDNSEMYIAGLKKLALEQDFYEKTIKNIQSKNYFSLEEIIKDWIKNFD
ncbi:glycosyltransferase family 4 protein [Proteus mirabilis]|uniref:glycosyltransferase family 4 protein n=1 Tax=Proteus mirabilis TaxID=584 RepID=UPI0038598465